MALEKNIGITLWQIPGVKGGFWWQGRNRPSTVSVTPIRKRTSQAGCG